MATTPAIVRAFSRTRRALRVAALAAVLWGILALPAGGAVSRPVVLTISATPSGHSLPPAFIGLAVENWTLTDGQFQGSNIGTYMRALGSRRLLRIGGNSLDESFWTSDGEPAPAWATQGAFGPASLRSLAQALAGTGWRVILGVNLKQFDPARAADEARYAEQILGSKLAAIEPGNEPDYYGIDEPTYIHNFDGYTAAIRAAVPGVPIVGPDAGSGDSAWLSEFARQEEPRDEVSMVTFHNYPESACNGNRPTIADLLSLRDLRSEQAAAAAAVAAGRLDHAPAIIDETNSAVCWGAPGTSNTFASALWALDYTMVLAQQGLHEVNFQSRIAGCAEYSPYCTVGTSTRLEARPEFYGLLAARQVAPGWFLRLSDPAVSTLRAYAVQAADRSLSVVLDNLAGAQTVRLRLPSGDYSWADETTLRTSSALGLKSTSTAGITLGGRRISGQAVMPSPRYRPVRINHDAATVRVAADSAMILKIGAMAAQQTPRCSPVGRMPARASSREAMPRARRRRSDLPSSGTTAARAAMNSPQLDYRVLRTA